MSSSVNSNFIIYSHSNSLESEKLCVSHSLFTHISDTAGYFGGGVFIFVYIKLRSSPAAVFLLIIMFIFDPIQQASYLGRLLKAYIMCVNKQKPTSS